MILKVSELQRAVNRLDGDRFIVIEDDDERESLLDTIARRSQCYENNWYYVLKIKSTDGNGCLKR